MSRNARTNVGDLPSFSVLPESLVADLQSICQTRTYDAGDTVVADGDMAPFIGFVLCGILRMQKTFSDGRQKIVGLLVECDLFGRVFDGPQHFAIEAATTSVVLTFNRKSFERLVVRCPELERLVLLNILNELDATREWMMVLGSRTEKERLAGFLLILCRRWASVDHLIKTGNETIEVKVPISRNDLAHLLGTRPESISRAVHGLAADGLITVKTPFRFEIRRLDRLIELCGGENIEELNGLNSLGQRVSG